MAYSVVNGAVGKSPLIDEMNQLSIEEVRRITAEQMEKLIVGNKERMILPVSVSFEACRGEIKEQLRRYIEMSKILE